MASSSNSLSTTNKRNSTILALPKTNSTKRPRINIKPPQTNFIDLTLDSTTPSPKSSSTSPKAPSAPLKTPSTNGTSNSSSKTSSSSKTTKSSHYSTFKNLLPLLTESSSGAYTPFVSKHPSSPTYSIISPQNQIPPQTNSPNGPLENIPSTPPSSPTFGDQLPYYFANNHTVGCACCYHNFHLIHSLRDELHIMHGHLEFLITQQNVQPTPLASMPPSAQPSVPPSSSPPSIPPSN